MYTSITIEPAGENGLRQGVRAGVLARLPTGTRQARGLMLWFIQPARSTGRPRLSMTSTRRSLWSPAAVTTATLGRLIARIIQGGTEQSPANHVHDSLPAKPQVLVSRDLTIERTVDVVMEGIVDVARGVLPRQEVGPRGAVLDDSLDRFDVACGEQCDGLDHLALETPADVDDALVQPEREGVGRQRLVGHDDGVVPGVVRRLDASDRSAPPSVDGGGELVRRLVQ